MPIDGGSNDECIWKLCEKKKIERERKKNTHNDDRSVHSNPFLKMKIEICRKKSHMATSDDITD